MIVLFISALWGFGILEFWVTHGPIVSCAPGQFCIDTSKELMGLSLIGWIAHLSTTCCMARSVQRVFLPPPLLIVCLTKPIYSVRHRLIF